VALGSWSCNQSIQSCWAGSEQLLNARSQPCLPCEICYHCVRLSPCGTTKVLTRFYFFSRSEVVGTCSTITRSRHFLLVQAILVPAFATRPLTRQLSHPWYPGRFFITPTCCLPRSPVCFLNSTRERKPTIGNAKAGGEPVGKFDHDLCASWTNATRCIRWYLLGR
jgi:hypothetical protein